MKESQSGIILTKYLTIIIIISSLLISSNVLILGFYTGNMFICLENKELISHLFFKDEQNSLLAM